MSQTFIVTYLSYHETDYLACALYEGSRLLEVSAHPAEQAGILGNIYVGRVKDIVKNLNAAFIEIAPGVPCYYPLEELQNPIFVKKANSPRLVQGDELYVQVEREAIKTKPPKVTTNLTFTGKYLALTSGNHSLGFSKKLDKETRGRLNTLLEGRKPQGFGLIVRTNSRTAEDEEILAELKALQAQGEGLLKKAPYQACFSCIRQQEPAFLKALQDIYTDQLEAIVTDDAALYEKMQQYLALHQPADLPKLSLYADSKLKLSKCYSLEVKLEAALKERVWLKTGGYLVIQPTEALTVIDVNSGKSIAKKHPQEHYLKVNLEAAEEIAFQLRLRNISGIIIVDFIDMDDKEARKLLMEKLSSFTKADPVPVQVVDMTKLNLVELTRKKGKKSLREQLAQ